MTMRKLWIAVFVCVVLVVGGWAVTIGALYALGGVATIEVTDRNGGPSFTVPVPMAIFDVAASSIRTPEVYTAGIGHWEGRESLDRHLDGLLPVIADLAEELHRLPDATLVEVVDSHSEVRVLKRGGKLVIEVDDPGTSVTIALPTRAAARLARRID